MSALIQTSVLAADFACVITTYSFSLVENALLGHFGRKFSVAKISVHPYLKVLYVGFKIDKNRKSFKFTTVYLYLIHNQILFTERDGETAAQKPRDSCGRGSACMLTGTEIFDN